MLLDTGAARKPARISLTPLIDVVFILLLFFMLSSSFTQWRQLDLPIPTAATSQAKEVSVVRLLDNEGSISIEGEHLVLTQQARLAAVVAAHPGVFGIDVAEGVNTQSLVRLVDALKLAGAENVSLGGVLP
ncbi:Biopolymer transport protein ExbD/TolR [Marinobacterium lacunae]|uniref:Biopolymer transport protein ExbD/TolR n=1 Tax=Marinobacterium lacunae TaxID=1232683 RepID=A0A081FYV1_9GAMM|nr:biopolymer transporter ExbD [Marinobacterium lacunae]KEA63706.1 Biopolymer transport protein ExbD/TolR [Marinobacterium lacunae]MBR9883389.1 biopolymer transporter ExbD [Oceanospirillales bacterium]